ncbi:MAG: hypothetical protein IIZ28_02415 [Erysipelotrichaceae bacterium]|nr:hypothetical protein [Erysipelotrichaceae bacterium]
MGFLDLFKKKEAAKAVSLQEIDSGLKYKDIPVIITFEPELSKEHIEEDFAVLRNEGIDQIVLKRFVPWLKTDRYKDRDDLKIFESISVYAAEYHYGRIVAKYSPTGEDAYFGQFEFDFESSGEYTADMMESCAMQVYVKDGEIVKVSGYDI